MKIENLTIKNFKGITDFSPTLGKVNVVVGPNGSGKSSFLESIHFLFTGEIPSNALKLGATEGCVEANILYNNIYRGFGSKKTAKFNGKTTTQKSIAEFIATNSGVDICSLKTLTSSEALSSIVNGEFTDYLVSSGLIPAEIDFDILKKYCPLSPDAEVELLMILPPAPERFGMKEIDEAYSHFFNYRKNLKATIAETKAKAKFEDKLPVMSLAQIDERLNKASFYASERKTYETLLEIHNKAVATYNDIQIKVKAIDEELKKHPVTTVDKSEGEFLQKQQVKLTNDLSSCNATITTLQYNIRTFERTLEGLEKPVCPISDKLVCTTDKTLVKEEVISLIDSNKVELEKAINQKKVIEEKIATILAKIKEFNSKLDAIREVEGLFAKRKALLSSLPEIPTKPVEPKIKPLSVAEKTQLIKDKETVMRHKMSQEAEAKVSELEDKLKLCEELITLLSPKKGLREKIIELAIKPIVSHANERAKELKVNFKIDLISDNGIKLVYNKDTSEHSEMLPLDNASSGEQLYCLLLIADALNSLSGVGVMIIDDLDKLDNEALNSLFKFLSTPTLLDNYDHIFLSMVNHSDSLDILSKHTIIDNIIRF